MRKLIFVGLCAVAAIALLSSVVRLQAQAGAAVVYQGARIIVGDGSPAGLVRIGVTVQRDHLGARGKDRPCVTAGAEGRIDMTLSRGGVESVDHLIDEHRNMGGGRAHRMFFSCMRLRQMRLRTGAAWSSVAASRVWGSQISKCVSDP